jgi:hypothetical protein
VTVVPHVLERKGVILFRKRQKNFHFLFMLSSKAQQKGSVSQAIPKPIAGLQLV